MRKCLGLEGGQKGEEGMNGHDPYAYIKDVLTRLPTQKSNQIEELLPHR